MAYNDPVPTKELVQERITDVNAIAEAAITALSGFTGALAAAASNLTIPYAHADQQNYEPAPVGVDTDKYIPVRPNIETIIDGIKDDSFELSPDLADVSGFPDAPSDFNASVPVIMEPTEPSPLQVTKPDEPELNPVTLDIIPDISLPTLPILRDVTWPDMITIDTPTFDGLSPIPLSNFNITPFSYNDSAANYTSLLAEAVKVKLLNDVVNGGTGLGADIETAIWERQKERDEIALNDAIDDAIATWSSRGYDLPNGSLIGSIDEQIEKFGWGRIDRSRDVAIKQAEIADKNTQFAVTSSLQNEQMWLTHSDNVANRALESARATVEMGIAIFKSQIDYYNSQLERYKTDATVYEQKVRSELLKAEMYKNLLESTRLQVDIRKQYIDIYIAEVQAVNTMMQVYNTRLEQSKIKLAINQQSVDIFRTQIESFTSLINAKVAEYGLYKAKWDGQEMKVKIYSEQAGAYSSIVGAYKSKADVQTAKVNAQIENLRWSEELLKADLEKYNIDVKKDLDKVDALIKMYQADAAVYMDGISEGKANAELDLERAKIIEQINESNIREKLQAAIQNLQAFVSVTNIEVEAAKGGAQFYAHLAASALQAINASMSIQSSFHQQASDSVSYGYAGQYGADADLPSPKSST